VAPENPLVEYRLLGGPVGIDQRLTVFADGMVELDERHRRRDRTRFRIEPEELERLRSTLAEVPAAALSGGPTLAQARAKAGLRALLRMRGGAHVGRTYFRLGVGGRSIAGQADEITDADGTRALLEELRARAVRLAESEQPTGGPGAGPGRH
jgi:hypothetical protein